MLSSFPTSTYTWFPSLFRKSGSSTPFTCTLVAECSGPRAWAAEAGAGAGAAPPGPRCGAPTAWANTPARAPPSSVPPSRKLAGSAGAGRPPAGPCCQARRWYSSKRYKCSYWRRSRISSAVAIFLGPASWPARMAFQSPTSKGVAAASPSLCAVVSVTHAGEPPCRITKMRPSLHSTSAAAVPALSWASGGA